MVKRLLVKKRKKFLSELTQEIPANGIITVGNDSSATIELTDEKIAPEQFVIVCEDGSMTLLCRVDGTSVNGENLPQGALHNLQFGDEISIDSYTLTPDAGETNGSRQVENGEIPVEIPPFSPDVIENVETPEAAPERLEKFERSLSDVIENLRSEEKFYFLIKQTEGESERVYVETEEMWLGWTIDGRCVISAETADIGFARAQIRKDWSGVVLYPLKNGNVWLNDETLTEPRRLKNDDKLFLLAKEGGKLALETVIKFHEPTALLILDSILPKELPPPISLEKKAVENEPKDANEADSIHSSKLPPIKSRPKRNIFGHFTITEIIIMTIGTLITAAVIFLILEFY